MRFGLLAFYVLFLNNVELFSFFELTARSVVIVDCTSLRGSVCSGRTRCADETNTRLLPKLNSLFNKHYRTDNRVDISPYCFAYLRFPCVQLQGNGLSKLCQAPPGKSVLSKAAQRGA